MLGGISSFYFQTNNFTFQFLLFFASSSGALALYYYQKNASLYLVMITFFLAGSLHTGLSLQVNDHPDHIVNIIKKKTRATVTGILLRMPEYNGKNTKLILAVDEILLRSSQDIGMNSFQPARGKIHLTMNGQLNKKILPGTALMIISSLKRTYNYNTPGVFNYVSHMAAQSIFISGWIHSPREIEIIYEAEASPVKKILFLPEQIRCRTASFLQTRLDKNLAGMYLALLIGNKSLIAPEILEQYKKSGTMHLLAISGIHMSLLGLMVSFSLCWLLKRSSWLMLHFHVPAMAAFLSLIPLAGYALIAGMNTPVLRAAVMAALVILSISLKREYSLVHLLAAAVLILLAFKPLTLFTVSFQLSFSAVLAITLVAPHLLQRLTSPLTENNPQPKNKISLIIKIWQYIETAFLVSLAATLGTLPFLLFHFNRFSPIGPIINILVEPFLCLWALPIGLIAVPCIVISPDLAVILFKIGGIGITAADFITAAASKIPGSSIWTITPSILDIIIYYAIGLLWFWRSTIKNGSGLALTATILFILVFTKGLWLPSAPGKTIISYLDVGQGSSTFIQLPQGETILLDGGSYTSQSFDIGARVIAPFLWKKRIWKLANIIITHPDSDHYSGMGFIQNHFKPQKLFINNYPTQKPEYKKILAEAEENDLKLLSPQSGQIIAKDDYTSLKCLGMAGLLLASETDRGLLDNSNDNSLVFKLEHGRHSFLFPGDISIDAEAQLLKNNADLQANILLAPHHGSLSSSSRLFIDAVSPEIIVVSAGNSKKGRFPDPFHLKSWKKRKIQVFQTNKDGTITIKSDGKNISLEKYLAPNFNSD